MNTVIFLHPKDNVATLITDLVTGTRVEIANYQVTAKDNIPYGHKIALMDIPHGGTVYKYGEPIGRATQDMPAGSWVHEHNCQSIRGLGK